MKNNNPLLPELRFPEFKNDGEWEEKIIENILVNGSSAIALNKLDLKPEGFPVYGADSIVGYIDVYQHEEEYISIVKDGSGVGRLNLCKSKSSILGTLTSLKSRDKKKYNLNWSYYLLNTIDFSSYVKGAGIPHIYYSDFKETKVFVPNPLEQQKIADCLSSLDALLEAHQEKLSALQKHKKGLLQHLFPQENEKVPKFRFKEFVNDGEWEETKLGMIAEFINGKAYKQEELLSDGKYRVLRVGNFFTNNEWYYSNLELDVDKYAENGDLLYAWSASFGPHIWNEEKVIYHYHIWKVKNSKDISKNFLFYLLDYETNNMKSKSLNGFALMHITKGTIENWDCIIPKTEKEQQKIADTLSSLDSLIQAQTQKIAQLQNHKKGMLQGLFPKINE